MFVKFRENSLMHFDGGHAQGHVEDERLQEQLGRGRAGLDDLDNVLVHGVAHADGLGDVEHDGALNVFRGREIRIPSCM